MKVPFHEVFSVSNGMIAPKAQVQIGGVTMSPGVSFGNGVSIGGTELGNLAGKMLEVDFKNGIYVIKGYYN